MSTGDSEPGQTVIFVEDDEHLRAATVQALELAGLTVQAFAGAQAALTVLRPDFDGVVVSDIRMPRMDGLQLLAAVRAIDRELPVILVTGHGDVPMAVSALKDGAYDFLQKPFAAEHLVATVRKAMERRGLLVENRRLRAAAQDDDSPLIGTSAVVTRLRATIHQLADADLDVLVEGETGTGKELAALLLHRLGPRRGRPFVAVDCAALPPGTDAAAAELFGHAADSVAHTRLSRTGRIAASSGGTLLLDDVDALSLATQAALLRVVEEREVRPLGAGQPVAVNLRVIATSRIDLAAAVAAGRFRDDLFHRLAATRLRLPPLREREGDPLLLFATFVEEARRQLGRPDYLPDAAVRGHVLAYGWPGNVRELRNYAVACLLATQEETPAADTDLPTRVSAFEAALLAEALRESDGSVVKALGRLGIPRKTLYYKLNRYGIDPDVFRPKRGS